MRVVAEHGSFEQWKWRAWQAGAVRRRSTTASSAQKRWVAAVTRSTKTTAPIVNPIPRVLLVAGCKYFQPMGLALCVRCPTSTCIPYQ
ncbi:unnamed protein product [Urochloa humidicola]